MAKAEPTEDHFDPTTEISLEAVKKRAVKGVVVLTGRTFFLQILALIAALLLTVLLSPEDFGTFFIISAVVNFIAYFSDIGLAAALIQTKKGVTRTDLTTTFTVQQVIVILLLIILVLLTPFLRDFYSLSFEGIFLLYALGLSLFMSSLKTIPSVLLERELDFSRLVMPQMLESIVYNVVAVFLAWKGFGIMSFAYAIIARGIVGLIAMYVIKPWMPGISFSKKSLKKLLKFGVPYQINTLLATIKDDGLIAVLGGILGAAGIGYLGWAQKWAKTPLRLFMDSVIKVSFPAFSRMQDDKEELAQAVTRSIFFVAFLVFPTLIGFLILAPMLVDIIPRYDKWAPALIPLYIISIDTIFATVSTQLTNTLNAIGKIKITFRLMVMWTILAWALIPFLSVKFGIVGAAVGYAIVSISSVVAIYVTRKYVKFSLRESIMYPIVSTTIMAIALLIIRYYLATTITSVLILGAVGFVIYSVLMRIFIGDSIVRDVKKVAKNIYSKA